MGEGDGVLGSNFLDDASDSELTANKLISRRSDALHN